MSISPPWGTDWKPPVALAPPPPKTEHLWKKGQSGNPNGKPPGTLNRKTLLTKEFLDAGSEVAAVVIAAAKGGDMQAANLVLARIKPPLRPRAETVEFALDPGAALTGQAQQVLTAIATGKLDPESGKLLIDCLSSFAGLKQIDELDARLAALEKQATETTASGALGGVRAI